MARGRKPKAEFADLDDDFKTAMASASAEEIKAKVTEVAKNEEENKKNKKADLHLRSLREELTQAGAAYKEASKANNLRIRFALRVLEDRGGA